VTDRLLTARELGAHLGLSAATVLDWFEADELPGFKLSEKRNGPVRFRLSEVEAWLDERRRGPGLVANRAEA
jgi:predicted DNA-binding transcriptional regulator AlpA